ncbi:MAG: SIMPL domain-containing protein [Pseudomonadota bacterium]|uniref:SIMPL domain-containing protein n=1 Tax=Alcanivorax sp. TaxID=1872427 RepID=UPI0025C08438|nr:SIMPL domain-containing protein [Alcanivorax sp.]MED5239135.1 SIMPL domain-containing protein [Pseudomonadota bacterium]MEE3321787.1 SIMPL domain-containing protein [Pseudomonadota bacterium]
MKGFSALCLTGLSALLLTACGQPSLPQERDSITVSGQGDVTAIPDVFSVNATARENGNDIETLKSRVDDQVDAMLELADDLDIPEAQTRATAFRVTPQWQYQPERKLVGHQVSRDVHFRVNGLERYAELLDGLARLSIRDIQPAGSDVSNADELAATALRNAVNDAREKAEILASAAGRDVGEAIRIEFHNSNTVRPVMMMSRAKDGAAESFRPGETDISAQVQITFELD